MSTTPVTETLELSEAEAARVPPSLRHQVSAGIRWGILDQALQQLSRLAIQIVLTKLLAPRDFGIMSIAFVVVNFAQLLSGIGFGPAIIQRKELTREHVGVSLAGSAFLGTLITVLLAVGAGPVASFFDEPRVEPVLVVISVVFIFKGLEGVPNAVLRRHLRFREFVLSSTIGAVVGSAFGITLGYLGAGVWALVGYAMAESFLAFLFAWIFALRSGVWRPSLSLDRRAMKDMVGYSAYVTAGQALAYGQNNGDNLIVGKALGATSLGYYNLAYRVMLFPVQKVAELMYTVSLPAFANVQEDLARLRAGFLRAIRYVALVCFPLTVGTAITAPVLVPLVFGQKWVPAVTTLQILALNGPRVVVNRLNGTLFHATGKPHWGLWVNAASLLLYVPAFLIGVEHGIEGVAVGFTVAGFVMLPIGFQLSARLLDCTTWHLVANFATVTVATIVMSGASLAAKAALPAGIGNGTTFAAMVATGALAYVVTLWVIDRDTLLGSVKDVLRRVR